MAVWLTPNFPLAIRDDKEGIQSNGYRYGKTSEFQTTICSVTKPTDILL